MTVTYTKIKAAVIDVIDDFSELNIVSGYGTKYTAKTKLPDIGISQPVLAMMPPRFNKSLKAVAGEKWNIVGAIDLVSMKTIGDMILLACGQSSATLPEGEPK